MSCSDVRCSSGSRTMTFTSLRPRCSRSASAPKNDERIARATSVLVSPHARASSRSLKSSCGFPSV